MTNQDKLGVVWNEHTRKVGRAGVAKSRQALEEAKDYRNERRRLSAAKRKARREAMELGSRDLIGRLRIIAGDESLTVEQRAAIDEAATRLLILTEFPVERTADR